MESSRRGFLKLCGLTSVGGLLSALGLSSVRAAPVALAPAPSATPPPTTVAASTIGNKTMKVYFSDPQFDYQLLRLLGAAVDGGSDIGECLSTAQRIKEGDFESWYAEWLKTAQRIHAIADGALAAGHTVSAREAYLRAMNYYRCAEFYLHGDPNDSRIQAVYGASVECFRKYGDLSAPLYEPIEIPYEDTTLPGYFYPAGSADGARPTLIAQTGYDGTQEELMGTALAAVRRGYHCVTFEGPGQGRVIREQKLPFRPDWEKVITPVVDHVLARPDVDGSKVALVGFSMGGYLVPRGAAFEHRLAAIIADGGVFTLFDEHSLPPGTTLDQMAEWAAKQPDEFDQQMERSMAANSTFRWAFQHGMYVLAAATPAEYWLKGMKYTMEGIADKITCPTLVIQSEHDTSFPTQAKVLYDALKCPKTWLLFTVEEGAGEHCQVGAGLLSSQRLFDWLDETLGAS
jgi:pimeloyl-ACP methyl ester carboxylesterase